MTTLRSSSPRKPFTPLLVAALLAGASVGCLGLPQRAARFDIEARTPESQEARAEADRLVQSTLREQRWDKKNAQRLRELLPQLSPESQIAIVQPLMQAVNSGKLKPAFPGPLF